MSQKGTIDVLECCRHDRPLDCQSYNDFVNTAIHVQEAP